MKAKHGRWAANPQKAARDLSATQNLNPPFYSAGPKPSAAKPQVPKDPAPRSVFKCVDCSFVGKDGSALASHVLAKHPSSFWPPTPGACNSDSDNVDDPSSPVVVTRDLSNQNSLSVVIPTASCRRGDVFHIIFPITGKIDCTENGCSRPFANNS
ncbi:hypothetical protein AVEN_24912-1 [Araneus ventricosus]|uniref:C2H2-type domain-containing protein n=1 Tax=Araneus ventricosus TaxID=182803 RepID=A0A4Y1ZRG1_ARAVE|nr:hypothetical protein AVEN_24912-1 [Araneus ventricosus]